MLGEDGMVMDDGVTACLADDHFHMTTTTGGAARVLGKLEDYLQTEWPDLKVYLTSVTEEWAVASICGPECDKLVGELCDDLDPNPETFEFMTWRDAHVGGVPVRVFRISFTGELSYEINIPRDLRAVALGEVMEKGAKYGIMPYGTEAMHLLRAEKGFVIVGQETDGTVTPDDLGYGGMVKKTRRLRRSPLALPRRYDARGPPAARRAPDRRSEPRPDGGDAAHRQRGGERAAGADARPRHVELFQPQSRPLHRAGAGEERAKPRWRPALGVAQGRRAGSRHRDRHGFPRPRGKGERQWLTLRSGARRFRTARRSRRRRCAPHRRAALPRQVHPARRAGGGRGPLKETFGLDLPAEPSTSASGAETSLLWLGPDEWMLVTTAEEAEARFGRADRALAAIHHQLVAVGDYYTVIEVSGPRARETLMKLTTLDLHPRAFKAGMVAGAMFGRTHATLWQMTDDGAEGGPLFRLIVRWSMADYLWCVIADAGREWGMPEEQPVGGETLVIT